MSEQQDVVAVTTVTAEFKNDLKRKIWATRGTRFTASDRLADRSTLSGWATGFLSGYLIILSVMPLYKLEISYISPEGIAFMSTAVAVMLLVFSQTELTGDYKIRANNFHKCGLELSEVYDYLILYINSSATDRDELSIIQGINANYESILRKYDNHKPVDFEYFKSKHKSDYDLNFIQRLIRKIRYFFAGNFIYYAMIFAPLICFVLLLYWSKNTLPVPKVIDTHPVLK